MRKAILLYNPVSGRRAGRRLKDVETAAAVLTNAGVETLVVATRGRDTVTEQVREAIDCHCDTILACGGDGTVHNVLQGLVGTDIVLGIIPMGTANALAHDLKIPCSPQGAAHVALHSRPKRVPVGAIKYQDLNGMSTSKYFTVAAGIGVDAHLFYHLDAGMKRQLGMHAYYAIAWHLWMSLKMEYFSATVDQKPEQYLLTELLAVRIQNFGGVLRELARGASLDRSDLQLVLCKTKSRMSYLSYVLRGLLKLNWRIPGIELRTGSQVNCDYPSDRIGSRNVYVEADGELLGTLPASITIKPNALTLLVPTNSSLATGAA
jgi:diacylglycerol kinase (ATP)